MITETIKNIDIELKEKIAEVKSCPLCSLIMDYEFNGLAQIQYEVTHSEKTRKQIAQEGGFCDFHFRQFKKIASGKTNILLLKAFIEEGSYKKENFTIECRICKYINEYEKNLLEAFTDIILSEEKRIEFNRTNGICFVHLRQVNTLIRDENTKAWLHRTHIEQIERMKADFNLMNTINSFYEIDIEKRSLINILIEKIAGRKTGAL